MDSLLPILTLLLFAASSQAEINCYSNNNAQLRDDIGEAGLPRCNSQDSCYEALGKSTDSARYMAGCGKDCSHLSLESKCQPCSTNLCNNKLSQQIRTTNLLCYFTDSSGETDIGTKKIWCADGVTDCYLDLMEKSKEKKYFAGCGKFYDGCKTCTYCETELCNLPDELKSSAGGQSNGAGESKKKKKKKTKKKTNAKGKSEAGGVKKAGVKAAEGGGDAGKDKGDKDEGDEDEGDEDEDQGDKGGKGGKGAKGGKRGGDKADPDAQDDNRSVPTATAALATVLAATVAAAVAKIVGLG